MIGPDPGHSDSGPGRSDGWSRVDATGLCGVGLGGADGDGGGAVVRGEVHATSASVIAAAAVNLFTDGAV